MPPTKPKLTKAERLLDQTRKNNKDLSNGAQTFILADGGGASGAIKAEIKPCQASPSSYYTARHGCFIAVYVAFSSGVDNLPINAADFYILGPENRRYNQGVGDAGLVPMEVERLYFSNLNKGEVLDGFLSFDAPAHGRLVYDPAYATSQIFWSY